MLTSGTSSAVLTGAPMYLAAFGLPEAPFSTTPDQRFLYLSDRHRDALAHLLYGVAERGGFVQLTGEVGTGKTTLCRYLLEHLPTHVDVALVLNPTVTRLELLATICDELRVEYPHESTSIKALVDTINAYLLDAHARGRRTVVIVDEAQHLSVDVLEQLRLLTNLETGRAKLLQIILLGQSELVELLSRRELRQVAQRVAARYHLAPLSEPDTHAYVAHRLAMAGQRDMLFDAAAIRAVHRASGGVPRLINVVCDRALLGAYATRSPRVTGRIARRAAREVAGEIPDARARRRRRVALAAAAGLVAAVGVATIARASLTMPAWMLGNSRPAASVAAAVTPPRSPISPSGTQSAASVAVPGTATAPSSSPDGAAPAPPAAAPLTGTGAASQPSPTAAPAPPSPPAVSLQSLLTDADNAFAAVAARWGRRFERRPDQTPCEAVRRSGLACLARRGTWNVVRKFDLPVVLELPGHSGPRFLAITGADESRATVPLGSRSEVVPIDMIEREWDGGFVLLWAPPHPGVEPIGRNVRGPDVVWLRKQLGTLDGRAAPAGASPTYDGALGARVTAFQRKHRLEADGIAGEETLAKLTALLNPATPSLRRPRAGR